MANKHLFSSDEKPLFSFVSSFVITHELLISEPDAAIVKIAPTGICFVGFFSPILNNQGLWSTKAPSDMLLAESNTDPPPTAKIKSTFSFLAISTPSGGPDSVSFTVILIVCAAVSVMCRVRTGFPYLHSVSIHVTSEPDSRRTGVSGSKWPLSSRPACRRATA